MHRFSDLLWENFHGTFLVREKSTTLTDDEDVVAGCMALFVFWSAFLMSCGSDILDCDESEWCWANMRVNFELSVQLIKVACFDHVPGIDLQCEWEDRSKTQIQFRMMRSRDFGMCYMCI